MTTRNRYCRSCGAPLTAALYCNLCGVSTRDHRFAGRPAKQPDRSRRARDRRGPILSAVASIRVALRRRRRRRTRTRSLAA